MKKTAIAIAVALTGFAALTQAAPLPNTWYTGGKLGWSHYYHTGTPDVAQNDGPTRKDDLGLGAFAGYQANPYLAFELGYDWLGRMAYKGDTDNGSFKSQGVQLTGKLSYPIVNNLDIYTRLGGMIWRADGSFSDNGARKSGSDTGVSPLAAIGLEYALSQNWATRLDYQWVHKIGDRSDTYARPDNTLLSAGLSYRFGQNPVAAVLPVAAAVAAAPATDSVQPEHFNLQSDVLFGFNKSSLKDSGKQTLDQLYSKLSTINPASGSTTVIGYTDHIGSNKYNQKLSEQRAQSVMNYLISKGIPADSISARGLGESNSVTGSQCNGIKNKAKLISCLSPDRRVEIEVKGLKQQ